MSGKLKLKKELETKTYFIKIFYTGYSVDFYKIYAIKTVNRKTGSVLTRFGTASQINQMLNTYHLNKKIKL